MRVFKPMQQPPTPLHRRLGVLLYTAGVGVLVGATVNYLIFLLDTVLVLGGKPLPPDVLIRFWMSRWGQLFDTPSPFGPLVLDLAMTVLILLGVYLNPSIRQRFWRLTGLGLLISSILFAPAIYGVLFLP